MKRIHIFLVSILFLLTQIVLAQNAPKSIIGSIIDASTGSIVVPITVTEFDNISSIFLTLDYDPAVMTYESSINDPAFSGMVINGTVEGNVVIGWYASSGSVTIPDGSLIVQIEFSYIDGSTILSFDNTSNYGAKCEYTNGSDVVLNDNPTDDYYSDGYITNHAAPITYVPIITSAGTGVLDVPVTVDNFWDIGSVGLSLEYDPNILTFTGATNNALFGTSMLVNSLQYASGKEKIVISWFTGPKATLGDGDILVTLHFTYAAVPYVGNYSELLWITDGTACSYGDEFFNHLWDNPYEDFYIDGLVAGQVAPGTYLPEITTAAPGLISVPVTVVGFQDIGAVGLTFEYDASVLNYDDDYTANAAFGGNLVLGNQENGDEGKITISYFGDPVTIGDLDYIASIDFIYIDSTTTLDWKTDGTACMYGDVSFSKLWDNPYEDYYFNGIVAGQVAPSIKADSMSAAPGTQISVPLRVTGFTDISSLYLTLDYNPGVLTYIDATTHPDISGSGFNVGSVNAGRIQMGWFSAFPLTLTDETVLIYLNFTYNGGTSPLTWYDNGGSCEFAAGITNEVLYDLPTEDFYINGLVEPADYIWTGATSTEWLTPSNWSGNIVPNSLSKVSIPSTSPLFWPVYTGDFTLGNQCQSIDFDASSEMTVTGNMIINPGNAFKNAGSGILKVGSGWLNSGIFDPGTGEVRFIGPSNGIIPDGLLPANEVQNYLLSTSPALMTPISGGTDGPTGDNAHSDVSIGFTFNYAGTDYTEARINTNGWLSLNLTGSDSDSEDNSKLFFSSDPSDALAPWWDDLMADGSSSITYITSGTAPYRVFTVEWNNVFAYCTGSTTYLNFQVQLYETTNVIEFCYGDVIAGTTNASEGASIGIKGLAGGAGDFIEATTDTKNTLITNLTSSANWPSTNYKFTPPSDTVTFYKVVVIDGVTLNVQTNVNSLGIAP